MKKKYISLATSILSCVIAITFFILFVVCIFNLRAIALKIQDTTDELGGLKLIKFAGVGYVLTVLGMVLAFSIGCFRLMASYYYLKIFLSDNKFYTERRSGILGFSFLAVLMAVICFFVYIVKFEFVPKTLYWLILMGAILYFAVFILPLIELVLNAIIGKKIDVNQSNTVPTNENITEELDGLADAVASDGYQAEENGE